MAFPSPTVRAALTLFVVAACGVNDRTKSNAALTPPPNAEFLVATQDSTFWISTTGTKVRTRGAPLTLARYDGRFFELYLTDDDRSYPDALLVGLRVYRRDLLSGDSVIVFTDSIVPRIAREYAKAHPHARPLTPDEDGADDPGTQATADLQIVDVHGPYLSFDYHVDVAVRGTESWHAVRRGVIDLRSGRATRVGDLFSPDVAKALVDSGKRELSSALDSLREDSSDTARRALNALSRARFDERSFVLTVPDSQLAVEFDVPLRGADAPDEALALDALRPPQPTWWADIKQEFPEVGDDLDRWRGLKGKGYDVVARYDSADETARISLSDRVREWPVRAVAAPVLHVFWLDRPSLDSAQRRALTRVFDEASLYDESARTVRDVRHHSMTHLHFASERSPVRRVSRHHT